MELINKLLLGDKYLERFRVFPDLTLFPPNWEALTQNRCPLCGNKLKCTQRGVSICKGVKHKAFVITNSKLNEIIVSQNELKRAIGTRKEI